MTRRPCTVLRDLDTAPYKAAYGHVDSERDPMCLPRAVLRDLDTVPYYVWGGQTKLEDRPSIWVRGP